MEQPATIDEYISQFPSYIQIMLQHARALIRAAAPMAGEKISWGMATFTLNGNLVHISGQKNHMGFHPAPSAIEAFKGRLSAYKTSKGTVQFPYDKPLPDDLITDIVRFRVKEQTAPVSDTPRIPPEQRPRYPMPEDIKDLLLVHGLTDAYQDRPPYQRNDYIGWISRAKREETREKRISQMMDELKDGHVYMGMDYKVRK